MTNLLTNERYNHVRRMRIARVVLASSLVLCAVALASALAEVPAYIVLSSERASLDRELSVIQSAVNTEQASSDKEEITHTRGMLNDLSSVGSGRRVAEAITTAISSRPQGVAIDGITYSHSGSVGTLVISGISADREGINTYRENLKSNALFSVVNLPVSALAGSSGGRFVVTLSGAF